MKYFQSIMTLILFVSFTACSSIDVSSDYDTTYDFTELKTYKWHHRKRPPKQVKHRTVAKQIDEMIEKILEDRGMVKSDAEEVDFLINYQAAIDGRLKATNYIVTVGYGGYGGWMYGGTSSTITAYDEGTLALDILDAEKNMLIYKSVAKVDMKDMEYDKTEMLDHIITNMLSGFPPGN